MGRRAQLAGMGLSPAGHMRPPDFPMPHSTGFPVAPDARCPLTEHMAKIKPRTPARPFPSWPFRFFLFPYPDLPLEFPPALV